MSPCLFLTSFDVAEVSPVTSFACARASQEYQRGAISFRMAWSFRQAQARRKGFGWHVYLFGMCSPIFFAFSLLLPLIRTPCSALRFLFLPQDRYYTPANAETCPPLVLRAWMLYRDVAFEQFKVHARDSVLSLIRSERDGVPQVHSHDDSFRLCLAFLAHLEL